MAKFYLMSLVFLLSMTAYAQEDWLISVLPKSEMAWQDQRSNQFDVLKESAQFSNVKARVGMELGLQYQKFMTVSWLGYVTGNEWEEKKYSRFREAYLGHEWSELGLEVSLGRRIIRQGTGYIARPTSLLEGNVQRQDPDDHWGELLGSDMLFLQWFKEDSTFSFAITDSDKNHNPRERPDVVFRYETLWGEADFALVAGVPEPTFGLAWADVFGEALELHADILAQRGTTRTYHQITQENLEPTLYTDYPYISPWEDSGRFFLYSVLGGQYSIGQTNIIFEWLHDSRGLSRSQFKKWTALSQYHRQVFDTQPALSMVAQANLLWDLDTLTTQGSMRDYLFLRAGKNTGILQPSVNLLCNAQDGSCVLSPEIRYKAGSLDVKALLQIARGAADTEFGSIPQHNTFIIQVRYKLF
ncbi:conserved hypothetical protein, secreted [Beggiatoa sp. PS]|nr:conserved hypothetical protein, secreted [Beggiatoa sp. PS]